MFLAPADPQPPAFFGCLKCAPCSPLGAGPAEELMQNARGGGTARKEMNLLASLIGTSEARAPPHARPRSPCVSDALKSAAVAALRVVVSRRALSDAPPKLVRVPSSLD